MNNVNLQIKIIHNTETLVVSPSLHIRFINIWYQSINKASLKFDLSLLIFNASTQLPVIDKVNKILWIFWNYSTILEFFDTTTKKKRIKHVCFTLDGSVNNCVDKYEKFDMQRERMYSIRGEMGENNEWMFVEIILKVFFITYHKFPLFSFHNKYNQLIL